MKQNELSTIDKKRRGKKRENPFRGERRGPAAKERKRARNKGAAPELQKQEHRLQQKEENLDRKLDSIEKKEESLAARLHNVETAKAEVLTLKKRQLEILEKISGFTVEEAKAYLIAQLESEVTHEAAVKIKEIEQRFKEEADNYAREVISVAIQRCAADHVAEVTVSVDPLPNDEMKGRIIGAEGRNIRTLETLTGVDLIIDDTPRPLPYPVLTRCAVKLRGLRWRS
jgi:ribonuclease Y